jgi:hypothetical protein
MALFGLHLVNLFIIHNPPKTLHLFLQDLKKSLCNKTKKKKFFIKES